MCPETHESEANHFIYSTGLSQERLREVLDYDPETGFFFWRKRLSPKINVGDIAGSLYDNGYIIISIAGRKYGAHALAWLYIHGELAMVDHKDNDRSNNRIGNLRKASYSHNNHRKAVVNPHGHKGVRFRSESFEANIRINGRITCLGKFDTAEEAGRAYKEAVVKYFGEFANES